MTYKIKLREATAILVNLICAKTFLMVPVYFKDRFYSGSLFLIFYIFLLAGAFIFSYQLIKKRMTPKRNIITALIYVIISFAMILVCSINLFEYSRTVSTLFFPTTPYFVIFIFFALSMLLGAYSGTCSVAKTNMFFVPIIYISVFLMLTFTFTDGNYYYLFPLAGEGFSILLKDGFFMLSSLFEIVVIFFLPEMMENKQDFKKLSVLTLIFSLVIYLIITAGCLITVHTQLPENCFSPLFLILRQIKLGTYFQHPDTAFLIIYLLSAFLYLSTMLFFASYIFSKTTKKLSKKAFFLPLGVIISVLALQDNMLLNLTQPLNYILWVIPFLLPFLLRRTF